MESLNSQNILNFSNFRDTAAVIRLKGMTKSASSEHLQLSNTTIPLAKTVEFDDETLDTIISETRNNGSTNVDQPIAATKTRGRKRKYTTEEERVNARRQQQREYRLRKKSEIEELKRNAQAAAAQSATPITQK